MKFTFSKNITCLSITTLLTLSACGSNNENSMLNGEQLTSGKTTSTKLQSSALKSPSAFTKAGTPHRSIAALNTSSANIPVSITNITGLGQAIIFFVDNADDCGMVVWSADTEKGPVATSTVFKEFDLSDPSSWDYSMSGWNPNCTEGTISRFGMFAAYWDLHLRVGTEDKVIRVAFGDYGKYKKGDMLIQSGNEFYWTNSSGTTLYPESADRPTSPKQFSPVANLAYHTDSEGNTMPTVNFAVNVTDKEGIKGTIPFLKRGLTSVLIDMNLLNPTLSLSSNTSDANILANFSPTFMDVQSNTSLNAVVSVVYGEEFGKSEGITYEYSSDNSTDDGSALNDLTIQVEFKSVLGSWTIKNPDLIESLDDLKTLFAQDFKVETTVVNSTNVYSLALSTSSASGLATIESSTVHIWVNGSEITTDDAFFALVFDPDKDKMIITIDGY